MHWVSGCYVKPIRRVTLLLHISRPCTMFRKKHGVKFDELRENIAAYMGRAQLERGILPERTSHSRDV